MRHLTLAVFILARSVFKMGVAGMLSYAGKIGAELTYSIGIQKKNPVAIIPGVVTYYVVRGALLILSSLSHDLAACGYNLKKTLRP